MTEEQLSALLRLKRYEKPSPEYFDRLLQDIHRRQRAELLRRPLWRIAADRLQTYFGEHSMGHLPYAGAMGTALVLGMGLIGLMTPGDLEQPRSGGSRVVASAKPHAQPHAAPLLTLQAAARPPTPSLESQPFDALQSGRRPTHVPRYHIDARPVSYERPFKF